MKKSAIAILALAGILTGCKKTNFVIPDEPFTFFNVEKISANGAWVDAVPANNDFNYMAVNVPKVFYDIYGEVFPDSLNKWTRDIYDLLIEGKENPVSFEDACLYKGSYYEPVFNLMGATQYVAVAFPYDEEGNVVHKVTKVEYTTPSQPVSAITFSVSVKGSVITIKPSNNDSYFMYSERKEVIEKDYDNRPVYYYYEVVDYFWEYEFFPSSLYKGELTEDSKEYYELTVGDKFYVMMSGYNEGISTDVSVYEITYNGEDKEGTVEPFKGNSRAMVSDSFKNGIQRTISRRIH